MNNLQKIGTWVLGGVVALAFIARQQITIGFNGVYLNGIITQNLIPLRVMVWISNKTVGSVFVRSLSGDLICNGKKIATIYQPINKRIRSHSYVEQSISVDVYAQETLQSLYANIQTGDINNFAFELVGRAVVGEQYPVTIKFNRIFTWQDIQQAL